MGATVSRSWLASALAVLLLAGLQLAGLSPTWHQHGVGPPHRHGGSILHDHEGQGPLSMSAPALAEHPVSVEPSPSRVFAGTADYSRWTLASVRGTRATPIGRPLLRDDRAHRVRPPGQAPPSSNQIA